MAELTRTIAEYIARTNYEDLSEEAVLSAKRSIMDTLGVMLPATSIATTSDIVHDLYRELDSGDTCTLIGYGEKASLMAAAYINGATAHAVDFDDSAGIDKPIVHPTACNFPAALALAEYLGDVTGKELITAVAISNDLGVRLGCCPQGHILWDYDFFPPTVYGVLQATITASKILKLDADQIVNALGLALNRLSGLRDGLFGNDYRSIREGFANQEGIRNAMLAQRGIAGGQDALELFFKYFYRDNVDLTYATDKLGEEFYNAKLVGYKVWPACQGTHAHIQVILETIKANDIQPDQIERVLLHGCENTLNGHFIPKDEKSQPTTVITAKAALPYVAAVAALRRSVGLADFELDHLGDPDVFEMTKRIDYEVEPAYDSNESRVEITTKDGQVYTGHVDIILGTTANPMSDDDLVEKFRGNAAMPKVKLSDEAIDALVELLLHLEDVDNARAIAEFF